jgi:hypothetical protein
VHRDEPADVAPGTAERGGELGPPVLLQRRDRRGRDLGIGAGAAAMLAAPAAALG